MRARDFIDESQERDEANFLATLIGALDVAKFYQEVNEAQSLLGSSPSPESLATFKSFLEFEIDKVRDVMDSDIWNNPSLASHEGLLELSAEYVDLEDYLESLILRL